MWNLLIPFDFFIDYTKQGMDMQLLTLKHQFSSVAQQFTPNIVAQNNACVSIYDGVGRCLVQHGILCSVFHWAENLGVARTLVPPGTLSLSLVVRRICFLAARLRSPSPCWPSSGANLSFQGLPIFSYPHKSEIACLVPHSIYSYLWLPTLLHEGKTFNGLRPPPKIWENLYI